LKKKLFLRKIDSFLKRYIKSNVGLTVELGRQVVEVVEVEARSVVLREVELFYP
jgi:hypothetical protein